MANQLFTTCSRQQNLEVLEVSRKKKRLNWLNQAFLPSWNPKFRPMPDGPHPELPGGWSPKASRSAPATQWRSPGTWSSPGRSKRCDGSNEKMEVELWWFVSNSQQWKKLPQGRCWDMCFYLFWTSNMCKSCWFSWKHNWKKNDVRRFSLNKSGSGHRTFGKHMDWSKVIWDTPHFQKFDSMERILHTKRLGKHGFYWFLIGQVEFLGHQPPKLWCTAQLTPYPIILIPPPLVKSPIACPLRHHFALRGQS